MAAGGFHILPLACLGPAAQENDQRLAVPAKIDPVAGPEVYPVFQDTSADTLDAGEVSLLQPDQCRRYLRRSPGVQPIEPSRIGATAFPVDIFPDRDHRHEVTHLLPKGKGGERHAVAKAIRLSRYVGNAARDAVGRRLDGIVGEMSVTGGGLNLRVTKELSDHRKPFADQQSAAGEAVP